MDTSRTHRTCAVTLFVLTTLGLSLIGGSLQAEPVDSSPDLTAELQSLRGRLDAQQELLDAQREQINSLQHGRESDWLNDRRREQVKTLIQGVLSDADTRASLAEGGMTAGYRKGFFLASDDGNFLLRFKGMIQTRYIYSHQDNAPDDNDRSGFDIGRTRFGFSGHIIDPSWRYVIWTGHHNNGDTMLLDAYIRKDLGEHWSATVGQFKLPFYREYLVSETKQQFVARSLLAGLSGKYTQGAKVEYKDEHLHLTASFNDGGKNLNKPWDAEDTDAAVTGRAEWLLFGDWKQYKQWESWRGDKPMLVLGAAANYQLGESGTATVEKDKVQWTADVSWEFGGANLFAAVLGEHIDNGETQDRIGVLVQGGYFITDKLEAIARYEWADLDQDTDETLSIVTVGANYFVDKHNLRLTFDVGYAFEPVPGNIHSDFAGYRTDSAGEDGQIVTRAQMQLLF